VEFHEQLKQHGSEKLLVQENKVTDQYKKRAEVLTSDGYIKLTVQNVAHIDTGYYMCIFGNNMTAMDSHYHWTVSGKCLSHKYDWRLWPVEFSSGCFEVISDKFSSCS
jgi:hypothetical protein